MSNLEMLSPQNCALLLIDFQPAMYQGVQSHDFMPEIVALFPKNKILDRTSMNSWLDAPFRAAVHATGRKKLVIAGLWTEACVLFPTLDLLKEGFEIYIAADACGDLSAEAHDRSMDRMTQAGAIPVTSWQFVFELQQDWARSETYEGVITILKEHSPYGIQVRFSKWALGEHASEAG